MNETQRAEWANEFGSALQVALSSAVATARGKSDLTIQQFTNMMTAADRDMAQTPRLIRYSLRFQPEPEDAKRLICERPEIADLLDRCNGHKELELRGLLTCFTYANRHSFVLNLVSRLALTALRSGIPQTVQSFDEFLTRSAALDLPGFHATFVSGVRLTGIWNIFEGLYAVPYENFRQTELTSFARIFYDDMVRITRDSNASEGTLPVTVLLQEFRWGPAISMEHEDTAVRYLANSGHPLDMASLVNLLSATAGIPLGIIGGQIRAKRWIYDLLDRHIDIGMDYFVRSPVQFVPGKGIELSTNRQVELQLFLRQLQGFAEDDRARFDLAVSRLAGALSRTGSIAAEDKVLDTCIALEILYRMTKRAKLSIRIGRFLGHDPAERERIESEIERLYEWRVNVVHGLNALDDYDTITDLISIGSDIAKETVRKYLERGAMPTQAELRQLERTIAPIQG